LHNTDNKKKENFETRKKTFLLHAQMILLMMNTYALSGADRIPQAADLRLLLAGSDAI
jgi:hypothetical protein